jgi:simple sugar transport system permease protein
LAGVRTSAITPALYLFCGISAGLAGLLVSSNVASADANNIGQLFELDAILAVSLGGSALAGGRFSLAGTLVGALIIQALTTTIYSIGVPPQVNLVVKALLVVTVLLLQAPRFRSQMQSLLGLARGRRT